MNSRSQMIKVDNKRSLPKHQPTAAQQAAAAAKAVAVATPEQRKALVDTLNSALGATTAEDSAARAARAARAAVSRASAMTDEEQAEYESAMSTGNVYVQAAPGYHVAAEAIKNAQYLLSHSIRPTSSDGGKKKRTRRYKKRRGKKTRSYKRRHYK